MIPIPQFQIETEWGSGKFFFYQNYFFDRVIMGGRTINPEQPKRKRTMQTARKRSKSLDVLSLARKFVQGKAGSKKTMRNCGRAATKAILPTNSSVVIRCHTTDVAFIKGNHVTLDNTGWATKSSADSMEIALAWINEACNSQLSVKRQNWDWKFLDGDGEVFSFGLDSSKGGDGARCVFDFVEMRIIDDDEEDGEEGLGLCNYLP